jgi:hypothetical protein
MRGNCCWTGALPPAFKLFQIMIHTYSDSTIKIKIAVLGLV